MNEDCLELERPISDAISRIRFAPQSNNLLVSSWDSVSLCLLCVYFLLFIIGLIKFYVLYSFWFLGFMGGAFRLQILRLYDVDSSVLRLEAAPAAESALVDCCFQDEMTAFSAGSDCSIRRSLDCCLNDLIRISTCYSVTFCSCVNTFCTIKMHNLRLQVFIVM